MGSPQIKECCEPSWMVQIISYLTMFMLKRKKRREKRGKRGGKRKEFGLSFVLLSTSPSMRLDIATNTFLLVFILSVFQCSVLDGMPELALHHQSMVLNHLIFMRYLTNILRDRVKQD
jgi:hypothetical protein